MGKFYVTTSIPYVNANPHIGFALEIVQADVLARYHRQKGDGVFFLTGADEHGVKIVRAAESAGKTPKEFTNNITKKFKDLKKTLNLSYDDFIRTSDKKRHWLGAQKLWLKLYDAGKLYKKSYKGLYCVGHEAFITEKDLVNGKCKDHQKEPEIIEEENWFFKLSDYTDEIKAKIEKGELRIAPESRRNEILSLINTGLEDISFSRPSKDLSWGIPVPNDPRHTMYVWCDALSNYITALGYGQKSHPMGDRPKGEKFRRWWPADVQVIGKDILRFHAAIWPGMLLAAKLPLPKTIFVHGFITAGGEKMSKTTGNVVEPVEVVKKYGADALRYYLLREIPSGGDGDFTYEKFEKRYNADLAKGLGNLVARVLALAQKGKIKIQKNSRVAGSRQAGKIFISEIKKVEKSLDQSIANFKFNEALEHIWRLASLGDKYIDSKKPWALKSSSKEFKEIIGSLLFLISEIGKLSLPFLPETAGKIAKHISSGKNIILFPRLK
ncbi:MAG: methionine--tRNA ligase [Candidatus Azambacteria bacterium]|nr:methionine--tRNA ligase [Candidatus Azambacteria bacterium]